MRVRVRVRVRARVRMRVQETLIVEFGSGARVKTRVRVRVRTSKDLRGEDGLIPGVRVRWEVGTRGRHVLQVHHCLCKKKSESLRP